jgi:hypothetical protein
MGSFISFQNAVLFALLVFITDTFIGALRAHQVVRSVFYGLAALFLLLALIFGTGLIH